jgi:hypothetical protein
MTHQCKWSRRSRAPYRVQAKDLSISVATVVAPAPRCHGSLQPPTPVAQGLALGSGAAAQLTTERLVAGLGHRAAGLATDRLPATQKPSEHLLEGATSRSLNRKASFPAISMTSPVLGTCPEFMWGTTVGPVMKISLCCALSRAQHGFLDQVRHDDHCQVDQQAFQVSYERPCVDRMCGITVHHTCIIE